jgi:hypothetical protein
MPPAKISGFSQFLCRMAHVVRARNPYSSNRFCDVTTCRELVDIRILVAFEDVYRAYREVIAAGIQVLRPQLEVTSTNLEELGGEIARLDPQVVISSLDRPASLRDGVVWTKVSIDFAPQSEVTLEALLTLIDEHPESKSPGGAPEGPGTKLLH